MITNLIVSRVDDPDRLAVREMTHLERLGRLFIVEPGDATHYEMVVDVKKRFAYMVVGEWDGDGSGVMTVNYKDKQEDKHYADGCGMDIGLPSTHTKEVCFYFCCLALGISVKEPETLAWRRRTHEETTNETP